MGFYPAASDKDLVVNPARICRPERSARERARKSKDPGAAACDYAATGSFNETCCADILCGARWFPLHVSGLHTGIEKRSQRGSQPNRVKSVWIFRI
jgi:hypothetical protein